MFNNKVKKNMLKQKCIHECKNHFIVTVISGINILFLSILKLNKSLIYSTLIISVLLII